MLYFKVLEVIMFYCNVSDFLIQYRHISEVIVFCFCFQPCTTVF